MEGSPLASTRWQRTCPVLHEGSDAKDLRWGTAEVFGCPISTSVIGDLKHTTENSEIGSRGRHDGFGRASVQRAQTRVASSPWKTGGLCLRGAYPGAEGEVRSWGYRGGTVRTPSRSKAISTGFPLVLSGAPCCDVTRWKAGLRQARPPRTARLLLAPESGTNPDLDAGLFQSRAQPDEPSSRKGAHVAAREAEERHYYSRSFAGNPPSRRGGCLDRRAYG
jgi:hypothetical protein